MPNGRCRIHGGKSLAGITHPAATQGGRYSKYLPDRLSARYEESKHDGELLALREEIALTDTRLNDLLARVDTGEAGELWRTLRQTWVASERFRADYDAKGDTVDGLKARVSFFEAFDALGLLTAEGAADYAAWDEVHKMVAQRRALAETETKRLDKMRQFIPAERANLLMAAVLNSVRAHVTDPVVLSAIAADVRSLASGNVRAGAN